MWLGSIEIDKIMMKLKTSLALIFCRLVGIGRRMAFIAVRGGPYYTDYFLIY
jgi:hypothetical protein